MGNLKQAFKQAIEKKHIVSVIHTEVPYMTICA